MGEILKVIGLMSGTSLDGVDAALLDTDGEAVAIPGLGLTQPYDAAMRARLRAALDAAKAVAPGDAVPAAISDAERALTDVHAEVVRRLLTEAGLTAGEVALIGFHGQTILHRPDQRRTWQIGDGDRLAAATGIDVVNDFRVADVAAGGQGAPFAPLYHAALVRAAKDLKLPVTVVNIGGVANVTYVGRDTILAFDTGPGNAPLDDWMMRHTGQPLDRDAALARTGRIREDIVAAMLGNPYFAKPPPKSLDRLDFSFDAVGGLLSADGAATLVAFTAASIARAAEHFPERVTAWIVCGGGRHNPMIMDELQARTGATVVTAEQMGWRGDFIEAEAFAYLAVRSLRGLPLSLPPTTGVPTPMTAGRLHRAAGR